MYSILVVGDHLLFKKIFKLMQKKQRFCIIFSCSDREGVLDFLKTPQLNTPNIAFVDYNLPNITGMQTMQNINAIYPEMKIVALSTFFTKKMMCELYQLGIHTTIQKSCSQQILCEILEDALSEKDSIAKRHRMREKAEKVILSAKEIEFLKNCATDLTYKEIAHKMGVKTRTVDNYRDSLFEKLNIKSRSGLIIHAIEKGIVTVLVQ